MVNYPNIPGTFVTQVTVTPESVPVGEKRACIIGETDIAFHGSPYELTPVFISSIEQAQVIFGEGGTAETSQDTNFLLDAVEKHLRAGGGSCWVIKSGPTGTFLDLGTDGAPNAVIAGDVTEPSTGTWTTGDKVHLCRTEYVTAAQLVTKGESFASTSYMYTVSGATKNISVTHTGKHASATGWKLYARLDGSNQWYLAGESTGAAITIAGPTALTTEAELPTRREDLLSQEAASVTNSLTGDDTGAWNLAIVQSDTLYDVDVVCAVRGHATRHGDTNANTALMSAMAKHAEECYDDQYKKRLAICPAFWNGSSTYEAYADMTSTADYTVAEYHFSDRLVKVSRNGMEGYVCGLLCNRMYYESPTFGLLVNAATADLGVPYPFSKAQQDTLIGLGWVVLKPYAGAVRVMRGVTAEMGNTTTGHPTIFKDISLRTNIDHQIESIQELGDTFIGSGTAASTAIKRAELKMIITDYLNKEKDNGAITAYAVAVAQAVDENGDELRNKFTVSLNLTPVYEINSIDVNITIGS